MKYLVCVADRHTDQEFYHFDTCKEAVATAEQFAKDIVAHPEHMKRRRMKGYTVFWQYDLEEDCVWVKRIDR